MELASRYHFVCDKSTKKRRLRSHFTTWCLINYQTLQYAVENRIILLPTIPPPPLIFQHIALLGPHPLIPDLLSTHLTVSFILG